MDGLERLRLDQSEEQIGPTQSCSESGRCNGRKLKVQVQVCAGKASLQYCKVRSE